MKNILIKFLRVAAEKFELLRKTEPGSEISICITDLSALDQRFVGCRPVNPRWPCPRGLTAPATGAGAVRVCSRLQVEGPKEPN